ncbi:keratinolytic protein [Colletotrichum incanum]|uniref:Chromatin modification-related protein EAF3 n=1 Tax=Colletotrichum incanum TaxID=1573173 RepID=A0A161W5U0_COLIC|nr:keratinolytic protein [Colletotrichum incanum]
MCSAGAKVWRLLGQAWTTRYGFLTGRVNEPQQSRVSLRKKNSQSLPSSSHSPTTSTSSEGPANDRIVCLRQPATQSSRTVTRTRVPIFSTESLYHLQFSRAFTVATSVMAPARQPAQPFSKDEKVLCFHGEMLYEAKILDIQPADSGEGFQYRIHYKGWKNTWDDWVSIDRIRKFTEENKELASTLHAQMKDLRQKSSAKAPKKGLRVNGTDSARGSEERTAGVAASGRGPRRARDFDLEQYEEYDGLAEDPDESQFLREDYFGDDEEDEVHEPGGQNNEESDEFEDDNHWAAQVDPRCYCLDLGGLDPDEPVGKSPSPEEIERRYTAFLSQWNKMDWQAPVRNPLSPFVSPRASIRPGRSRALSVISISSDESESGILSILGDISNESNSSVEFLGASPVKSCNGASHYSDATLKQNSKDEEVEQENFEHHPAHMQALQEQENADVRDFEHVPVLMDLIEEPAQEKEPRLASDYLATAPPPSKLHVTKDGRPNYNGRYGKSSTNRKREQPTRVKPSAQSLQPEEENMAEDGFHARPSIKLPIPDHIKAMLVDDWENITKNNQLVPLPHPHPVDDILNDYLNYERPNREDGSANMDILEEVVAGLREYFEKSLSRILLYRFERPQYHEIRKVWEKATENDKHKSVCDTYGPEHLCRLMVVSLPELVAQTNMDQQSVSRLREELSKLTVWLGKNAKNYFVSEYETPSQEYIDKARSF